MLACITHCTFAFQCMPIQRDARAASFCLRSGQKNLRTTLRSQNWVDRTRIHQIRKSAFSTSMILQETGDSTAGLSMNIILVSCMALAILSTLVDNSGIVMWISNRLLPDDDEISDNIQPPSNGRRVPDDQTGRLLKPKIRNPITNRLIDVEGPTFRDLDRRGLLPPLETGELDYGANDSMELFQYQEIQTGEGVTPDDGSVAVIRFEARVGGPEGPIIASTPFDSLPFAFEVGDRTVWRGLDAAVRRMREGAIVDLVLPPQFGYTRSRTQPEPSPGRGRAIVDAMLLSESPNSTRTRAADSDRSVMYVRVRLDAVLALPPAMLAAAAGGAVPPQRLRKMLRETPDGRFELSVEADSE